MRINDTYAIIKLMSAYALVFSLLFFPLYSLEDASRQEAAEEELPPGVEAEIRTIPEVYPDAQPYREFPRGRLPPQRIPQSPLKPQGLPRKQLPRTRLEKRQIPPTSLEGIELPRNRLPRNQFERNPLKRNPLPGNRIPRKPFSE